ncbi:MAG: hypothetical protein ACYDCN_06485 [Bacteroidia bacterium]
MFKRNIPAILFILLLLDVVYSFNQHLSAPLDGDMAENILPAPDYKKVLEDPFALDVLFHKTPCAAPNRFFAHFTMSKYFKTVPFLFQHFTTPINSIYLSCAWAKILIQIFIIFLLSLYISFSNKFKASILLAAVLITPLFQTEGYNAYMGIIDRSTTYTFFYALPLSLLLLFFLPFYKEAKFTLATKILLFILMVVLSFNGPLIPGIVLVICPMVLLYQFYKNYQTSPPILNPSQREGLDIEAPFPSERVGDRWRGALVAIKQIPSALLFYFTLFCLLSLYSLYVGSYNTDGFKQTISLGARFSKIPEGIYLMLTQKLGFPVLLFMLALNTFIIKRNNYTTEGQSILNIFKWIGIFSAIYILLLPFGGYRVYRPDIVRYDSIMPITIALLFMYGYSTIYIISNISAKFKSYYLTCIIVVAFIFTNADKPFVNDNACERSALQQIATATEDTVRLKDTCTVMDWRKIINPKASETNAQMLLLWGVTTKKKLYYRKAEDLFYEKIQGMKKAIRTNAKWLSDITKKAAQKHISVDSCINMDARWMAQQEMEKIRLDPMYAAIERWKMVITNDKKWLSKVIDKAKASNVSLDTCIYLDAKWMAEQELRSTQRNH